MPVPAPSVNVKQEQESVPREVGVLVIKPEPTDDADFESVPPIILCVTQMYFCELW